MIFKYLYQQMILYKYFIILCEYILYILHCFTKKDKYKNINLSTYQTFFTLFFIKIIKQTYLPTCVLKVYLKKFS